MRSYIIRRILLIIPTFIVVSMIIFLILRLIPGSVIDTIAAQYIYLTNLDKAAIEKALGLNVPIYIQYFRWMGQIFLHGNFGKSFVTNLPVVDDIKARWPITFELGIMALLIGQLIALPVGIYSAMRQDTVGDYITRSIAILCIAVPDFWVATMVIVFPSIWWHYTPSIMLISFGKDPLGNLKMFIIPALVLGMQLSGMTMRMMRTMMLEVLRQDYIRTAWAKGLKERVVIMRHALKNAFIPVITIIGWQIPLLFGGAVIIENIFQLPGMGQLMVSAVQQRDYPTISAIMIILTSVVLILNLLIDLVYSFLDPRIHYK
ncbi:MAG: ABC transporter permease [Dehalococcoidales bacterium]|jgi:peptide/nickel transport system permease protein